MTNYEIDHAFSVFRHIPKKQGAYNKQYCYSPLDFYKSLKTILKNPVFKSFFF